MTAEQHSLQVRVDDLEVACDRLRWLVGDLATERDALAEARDRLADANRVLFESRDGMWLALLELLIRQSRLPGGRLLMIWGAGAAGRALLASLRRRGAAVHAFIDSDAAKTGTLVDGVMVVEPAAMQSTGDTPPYVLVASIHAPAIAERLRSLGCRAGIDFQVVSAGTAGIALHA